MGRAAFLSFVLHLVFFLLIFFGIPWFSEKPNSLLRPIPVEVFQVGEKTLSPKPTLTPVQETEKQVEKKPEVKPEPQKPTPLPSPAPEEEAKPEPQPTVEEKPAPPTPEPPQEPAPSPTPKPEAKPEPKLKPKEPEPAPKPAPKPVKKEKPKEKSQKKEKKQEKPSEQKKKKKEPSFDSILKNLEEMQQNIQDDRDLPTDSKAPPPPSQAGEQGEDLTISELDQLQLHFRKCWSVPAGVQNADQFVVSVYVIVSPDGTVKEARLVDENRSATDPYYRSMAEAALRAAKDPRCAKLPLSPDTLKKYDTLKINFDPRSLLGG